MKIPAFPAQIQSFLTAIQAALLAVSAWLDPTSHSMAHVSCVLLELGLTMGQEPAAPAARLDSTVLELA